LNPNISNAFEEAQVDTLIMNASKGQGDSNIFIWAFGHNNVPITRHEIAQSSFQENEGLVFDVEVDNAIRSIIQKVRSSSTHLEEDFEITRGVNPYDKYRGQSEDIIKKKAYHSDRKKDSTFVPELRGKHVATFFYEWDKKHYISYGDWLAAPRDPKYFMGKRILFREIIGSRFVCTTIDEEFVIDRSLYIAKPKSDKINVDCVLAILASKLLVWLFKFEKNEFDDLFPKIRLEEFKKLPIPKDSSKCNQLQQVVNKIIETKREDKSSNTDSLEQQLDQYVYAVYGLTEEEVKIIEA
jgi:hypothetical protein